MPSLFDLIKNFFSLGLVSFGPGMFALIHQRVVEQKNWMTENDFKEAVTFSELAPGPFTLHIVMYVGYHLKKLPGLIVSTFFFSLPSLILVVVVALTYQNVFSKIPGLKFFMIGVWAAIIASMLSTIIRIGKDTLKNPFLFILSLISIGLILYAKINFIWLIILIGLFYTLCMWLWTFSPKK